MPAKRKGYTVRKTYTVRLEEDEFNKLVLIFGNLRGVFDYILDAWDEQEDKKIEENNKSTDE